MQVKVLVLANNQILVSQIEEVAPLDIGDPNCKLIEPFLVKEDDTLSPWLIDVTNDNEFMMCSDKILTLVEAKPTLLEKYQNLIK
jgi:hypothetical protein|tara:strand:- start:1141 stop:1395 length:255 start_codon:yes stop_codon:yes gene_type:complete